MGQQRKVIYDIFVIPFPYKLLDKQKDSASAHNSDEDGVFGDNLNMHSILLLMYFPSTL